MSGTVERTDDFAGGTDVFRTDTLELPVDSQSPGVPSVGCTLRYSLAVTGDSESDDDGLVLLISYKILLDITGTSEQAVFKLTEDALLALVSSTTYCYQTKDTRSQHLT